MLNRAVLSFTLVCAVYAQPGGITSGGSSNRPIFVSGKVVRADGRPPEQRIVIELVCQGKHQIEGRTDETGSFSVQLGLERFQASSDASATTSAANTGFGGALSGQRQVDGASIMTLAGCFLRGVLKGFQSDTYDLSRVRVNEPVNVGMLVLRQIGETSGAASVSATSLAAPKNARLALTKGRALAAQRQWANAAAEFAKAVKLYPKYAEAWEELGEADLTMGKPADAQKAFLEAVGSDSHYLKAEVFLARIAATNQDWKGAIEHSSAVIQADSEGYAQAYYYNAVAHYNLNESAKALESAQHAVRLDTRHTVPLAEQLLGVLFADKGDFKQAVDEFQNYLAHVPADANVTAVKRALAEAQQKLGDAGKN